MAQNKFWSVDDVIYMGYFQEKLFKKGKSNMKIIIERLLNFWASKNKPSIPCPPSDPSSKKKSLPGGKWDDEIYAGSVYDY